MNTTEYAGIDYGMGQSNIDKATGIRLGVISQNEVLQAWADSAEPDYGKPHCPKCGNEAKDAVSLTEEQEEYERAKHECEDFVCQNCEYIFGSESAYPDEPVSYDFVDSEYNITQDSTGDLFVIKSPYFTYAQFCSPCAPGACHLMYPLSGEPKDLAANKCYCLGKDWFEGDPPYPIYSMVTGERVSV